MTSHEWAKELRKTALVLESKPDVDLKSSAHLMISLYGDKDAFVNALRALKPGRKKTDADNSSWPSVHFYPAGTCLDVYINRDAVCHKVQDIRWECEPLLSPQEDAELEAVIEERAK